MKWFRKIGKEKEQEQEILQIEEKKQEQEIDFTDSMFEDIAEMKLRLENIKSEEEKAIYGAIYSIIRSKLNQNCTIEEIGEISINIKEEIQKRIKRDWQSNEEVKNLIRMYIDEEIYMYIREKNIELSFSEIDIIIEAILKVAIRIYKK